MRSCTGNLLDQQGTKRDDGGREFLHTEQDTEIFVVESVGRIKLYLNSRKVIREVQQFVGKMIERLSKRL